jgi:hypothetical protein
LHLQLIKEAKEPSKAFASPKGTQNNAQPWVGYGQISEQLHAAMS